MHTCTLRHLWGANGQSLHCRGTKDLLLELSDQEHAPRIHIGFAAEELKGQQGLRIDTDAIEGNSNQSRCLTKNGPGFLARLTRSERLER